MLMSVRTELAMRLESRNR